MAPPVKARYGCDPARKWRPTAALCPSLKRTGGGTGAAAPPLPPPLWHARHHPGQIRGAAPHLPLFHGRHAEESAERPRLVTVVHPSPSAPRKVTVLLNRRGVVSFEQLLLDVSEALGFPRWHRSRVTRLYTAFAREVKSVGEFFHSDTALLALGKGRPELNALHEALEELFPEQSRYRAEALLVWEKKLRPGPDKAAKADSGYSEGMEHKVATEDRPPPETEKLSKGASRKAAHHPNHLQKLRVRGRVYEEMPPAIGQFQQEQEMDFAPLCENCLARRAKRPSPEWNNPFSRRAPLPPVRRKQMGSSPQDSKSLPAISSEFSALRSEGSEVAEADVNRLYEMARILGDGNFAVVRECRCRADGRTLAVKMDETAVMVADVSEALKYIHRRSVVHRDVKPENLLIVHTVPGMTRLKLADFGLAMVVSEPVFTICGTPTYVAPEILSATG
ncbi:serine/threonine-protein kinase DCLK3-like [Hippocampus comes]|uniref:serine/threonine-protein kinase DCLK3-like n=1 Tax=Hippocampus comes TaxID=109280 RepID=UPI00094E74E4|nr:PREDICTED: serine/threonine-protein kinase DCLK3-like [Hippocampus comes]